MKQSNSSASPVSAASPAVEHARLSPWQQLRRKRVSYLTLPLLVMATLTEIVILATGWKYQQTVCLPDGMGVTFLGIGPIGATILAVELLKLPLAIWTASRMGWTKGFMLFIGLPLICLLTFQLVKDMAVYEMGVALEPASELLEKASAEETRILQLKGDLAAIEEKKAGREQKLAELTERKAKAKADLEEALEHNETTRQDAITLTDYQKQELSEVEERQANIIALFNADTAQLRKAIADLHQRREVAVGRATKWNLEDARIENEYKAALSEYTNELTAYEKAKAEYDAAGFVKRKLMKEPVHPGVPPERETNKILKPTALAEIDAQIQAKEAELAAINEKRRAQVAQVEADARRLREDFDRRSSTRREETDRKREELLAAHAALLEQWNAEQKEIDQGLAASVQNVDGIRAEIDASRERAEELYEAREAAIRDTQVHRIATTVEIVRGLLFGKDPLSITATAKERGDILTDQISMVRIWVYPVLAFIVAFLPTLMVEVGFSTVFEPEQKRRTQHRLGFLGRRMHAVYTRAGRLKIARFERVAKEATGKLAARNKALAEKEAELQAAREGLASAAKAHEAQSRQKDQEHQAQLKQQEEHWVAKTAGLADSLNRVTVDNEALRDSQKGEIERQIQLRQNSWTERLKQLQRQLDHEHATSEEERTALAQEHHKKLLQVTEESKAQVAQARRKTAEAEQAAEEKLARLTYQLADATRERDAAVARIDKLTESHQIKLRQAQEDAVHQVEKAAAGERQRTERQQLEFAKAIREREAGFERRLKEREEELSLQFEARLLEEQKNTELNARRRAEEQQRQLDTHVRETDARWRQALQQQEEAFQTRLKQRELQLQAQADARLGEMQTKADQQLRLQESETERRLETQAREAAVRLEQELHKQELAFQSKLKQREQEATASAAARESDLQDQWASELRSREQELERRADTRLRALETRLGEEARQNEAIFQSKLRQRDQQWQAKLQAVQTELRAQSDKALRQSEVEAEAVQRDLETRFRKNLQCREEAIQADTQQREQKLRAELAAQAQAHEKAAREWENELEIARGTHAAMKAALVRAEKERDEAKRSASEGSLKVRNLEERLMGASSLLASWKNGNGNPNADVADEVGDLQGRS